jgi:xanthine dehydrogenase YagR molybdenum-binding subunit
VADLAPGYAPNILDEDRQGVLGRPLPRTDGPIKVTGRATYAYEYAGHGGVAYGFIVGATIANGRITAIDTSEALLLPGVLMVMTHRNAPKQADYVTSDQLSNPFSAYAVARPVLKDDKIRYHGEPVALVVAESLEIARDAAARIKVTYVKGKTLASRVKARAVALSRPIPPRAILQRPSRPPP